MKKYLVFAVVALAASAACSKVETIESRKEIKFEVAKYVQTRADGSVYDATVPFGSYAWFTAASGSTGADFMVNEQVAFDGTVWSTADHTFYWPKTGYVEFISYSPFAGTSNTAGTVPVVTEDTITYTNVTIGDDDLMYADKVRCSQNVNLITDSDANDSGFSGVPTLFRHALAKVSFKVRANFVEWGTTPTDSTKWEVTVRSAKISGFKNTGSCALTLNADGKHWDKPVTEVGSTPDIVYIWTNASGATTAQELVDATTYPNGVLLTTTAQDLNPAAGFVLPQELVAGAQKLDLDIHIKTTLANGKVIEEDYVTAATPAAGQFPSIDISAISSLKYWQMNQNIVYTINFKPTAKVDQNDTPEDVIITFDPAVADWDTVDVGATIQI